MWKNNVFEDGKERQLDLDFDAKEEAEIWADSIGFELYKAMPVNE